METTYSVQSKSDEYGDREIVLSARDDQAAREQAQREAKTQGWPAYWINFHRKSDGQLGTIEP